MKKILSVLFSIVLSISLVSCKKEDKGDEKKVINYNLESEPSTLDPQIAVDYSAEIVIMNIFEGLTRIDKHQKAVEGVAKSWESNRDHTSYTFNLREDAVWADEEKTRVTAYDFVFGIKRAVMKETKYQKAEKLYCIKNAKKIHEESAPVDTLGVTARDDHTLIIDLESAYEDLPRLVATSPFMPCNEKFFESTSGQYGREFKKIVGNGPFKIKDKYSWVHYEKLELSLNSQYVGNNNPLCAGVFFTIARDMSNPVSLINSQKIDAAPIAGTDLAFAKESQLSLTSFKDVVWGICFNLNDELVGNDAVRLAFIEAVNREYVVSTIPDNCSRTSEVIPDTAELDGYSYRNLVDKMSLPDYDKDKAKDTLKNFVKDSNVDEDLSITILCPDETGVKSLVSRIIENWNEAFGIYVNMKPLSKENLSETIDSGTYQIAIYNIKALSKDPVDVLSTFKSDSENNFINLKDSTYDSLFESISLVSSIKERAAAIFKVESLFVEKCGFYPLYNESRYFACSNDVEDILFHPYDNGIDFTKAKK